MLEGGSREERKKQRAEMGSLHSLTVQPRTRERYNRALEGFWAFLRDEGRAVPYNHADLDLLLQQYIEHLWTEGFGRAQASDTVAALQDAQPQVKGHLRGTWRLLKAWSMNEIPNRAPPLPEEALQMMVGYAFFKEQYKFGLSLLVGFYGTLRTGEILSLCSSDVSIHAVQGPAVLSLGLTKAGKRQGASESVTLTVEEPLRWLHAWSQQCEVRSQLCPSPAKWRQLFNEAVMALGFEELGFRPYSLRRGGATFFFQKWGSLDRLLVYGRWQAAKTARTYVNSGLAALAEMNLPRTTANKQFRAIFLNSKKRSVPSLEPTPRGGRAGGGGKKSKRKEKERKDREVRSRIF